MQSAREELQKRLKHIRIADKSEFGWDTVDNYMSDELASNSEDDKRLKKAETEAGAKRKKRQQNFQDKRRRATTNPENIPSGSGRGQQFFRGQGRRTFPHAADRCYQCNDLGHLSLIHI